LTLGKYCEKRDPNLAFIAYKRGANYAELIEVTNRNALFKQQARFLVERQDLALYATVLREDNEYRRQVIDQIVQTALPEVKNPEEVSTAVKAFMNAGLPNELIELLDKVVVDSKNPEFAENKSLQNLLILTAIKADTTRVKNYVNRLDKYDAPDIANVAIQAGLFEEAFTIYKKFKLHVNAIQVLIDNIGDIEQASEFAERVNQPEVFSKLGKAQLDQGAVSKAIASFIKANDPEYYNEVIAAANQANNFEDLVKYLEMCRKKVKEAKLESELAYAYARTGKNAELETFVSTPGCLANILDTGERCFEAGLYEAAKIMFSHIDNYSRLASALVKLGEFSQAVDAARKANSLRTWKEVNLACVEAKQFRLAQTAGLYIIPNPDELDELVLVYETRGHFDELIALLETGANQTEGTHNGLFTALAITYSKYKEDKLMSFLKDHHNHITYPRVIASAQANSQWPELTFLQIHYDEFDNAVMTMIQHHEAWEHPLFKETIVKVTNHDICYKAIQFYLEEHPMQVNDLMTIVTGMVDHSRVVFLAKKMNHIPLMKPYLQAVQDKDIPAVNDALHELYIDEEDFEALRASIDRFTKYEAVELAKRLETHELLEFRRISAYLYKQQGRFSESVELSKKDKLYRDAIETAAKSKKQEIAEELLIFFVGLKSKECFAACLFTCYDLIRPDVALELAWRNNLLDFAFPFLIQVVREYTSKVDALVAEAEKKKKEAEKKSETPSTFVSPEEMYANQIPQIAYYDPNAQPGYGMPYPPNTAPGFGQYPPYSQY
jgi:clathrin heavy chain